MESPAFHSTVAAHPISKGINKNVTCNKKKMKMNSYFYNIFKEACRSDINGIVLTEKLFYSHICLKMSLKSISRLRKKTENFYP